MKSKLITIAAIVCAVAVVLSQRFLLPVLQFFYELIVDAFNPKAPVPAETVTAPAPLEIQQKPVTTAKRTVRKRTTATKTATTKRTTKPKPNESKPHTTTS